MSLNYYYSDVANADKVMFDENDYMYSDTQSIIFATMSVGLGELTEKNWTEFYARMHIVEKLGGYGHISPQRLREHIGLRTNVHNETRAQWMKRWFSYEFDGIIRKAEQECEVQAGQPA
jgi:hypothetical protein